jgi:UDP-N-acetylglucosamine 1-carboxyvinyltransferase
MDKFSIQGGAVLKGTIEAGGSKNCALPVLFATILAPGRHKLARVPRLQDMESTMRILVNFGCSVEQKHSKAFGSDWIVDTSSITNTEAPYDLVRKMRASFFCLGPLLARAGRARVSMPGGCAIGARPVDLHLMALEKLGAEITQTSGYVEAAIPKNFDGRLKGATIHFPIVSVGATENAVMAAVLARGTTIIENAAREPEVRELCNVLSSMGAKIRGAGNSRVEIVGVESLKPMDFTIPPDRIEAATYLIGAHLTGGDVTVRGASAEDMGVVLDMLEESGAKVEKLADGVRCIGGPKIKPVDIKTAPFPGFPTDVQAQWVALMTRADGDSVVTETIFENRFMHVPELTRMGAQIDVVGSTVRIKGQRDGLQAAPVMATDLRASACLVLAGLAAKGETTVRRIYHLDRGYESMENKLHALGANVQRSVDG